jgi:hypothetical protein
VLRLFYQIFLNMLSLVENIYGTLFDSSNVLTEFYYDGLLIRHSG